MAKKATGKSGSGRSSGTRKSGSSSRALARTSEGGSRKQSGPEEGMGDAFIKLLQSPLVADLLAVAATAALAALAEHGFSNRGASGGGKRAGKAAKEAGKAAVAAMGRRLGTEMDEIRAAAKKSKAGAGA